MLFNLRNIVELKASEKGLEFNIYCDNKEDKIFYGDQLRIRQVLINLTNNAIKFTENGKVNININLLEDNLVRFTVEDTGIGLGQEQQEKLFQSFSQADGSTTRKYGGTGLGLSISKQLVELMDGKIWCQSELEKGSIFIFEIELPKGNLNNLISKTDTIKVDKITGLQGSNILLVEDNEINLEVAIHFLEETGINIDTATNGQEAIEKIEKNRYDAILMDIQMPIMDGIELTRSIYEINPSQTIIILSAYDETKYLLSLINLGIEQFIKKPIDYQELLGTFLNGSKKIMQKNVTNTNNMSIELSKNFIYDKNSKSLIYGKENIYLTKFEIIFIELLTLNEGKIYSNEDIVIHYNSLKESIDPANIRKLVSKLRKKLPQNCLESIYAIGYKFIPYFKN